MTAMSQKPQSDDTAGGVCRAMTDEELDALVKRLENVSLQVGVPSRTVLDSDVIRSAAAAITTLRAQLAEVIARTEQAEAEAAALRDEVARLRTPGPRVGALRKKFEQAMRGRTWSTTDMQVEAAFDHALAAFKETTNG